VKSAIKDWIILLGLTAYEIIPSDRHAPLYGLTQALTHHLIKILGR
jgi:hypothetical protein